MPDRHTHRVGAWAVAFVGLTCTVTVECRDSMDTPPHIVMVLGDDIGCVVVLHCHSKNISPTSRSCVDAITSLNTRYLHDRCHALLSFVCVAWLASPS